MIILNKSHISDRLQKNNHMQQFLYIYKVHSIIIYSLMSTKGF